MSRVSLSALADLVDVPTDPAAAPLTAAKPATTEQRKSPKRATPEPAAGGVVPTSEIAAVSAIKKQAADATTPVATPGASTPSPADRPMSQSAQAPVETSHMRWHEYERKETRLREDQYGRLTAASRRLNKLRRTRGERITENTLIRVAIDLLLNEEARLCGVDEAELRQSVGL
jgi:hypothetical protein